MLDLLYKIHSAIDTFSPRHAELAKQVLHRLGDPLELADAAMALRKFFENDTNCAFQDFPNPFDRDDLASHEEWHEAYTAEVKEPEAKVPALEDMTKDQLEAFARDNLDLELDKRLKKPDLLKQVTEALENQSQE